MLIVLVSELDALMAESGRMPGRLADLLERARSRPLQPDAFQGQLLTGQIVPAAPLTRRLDCPGDADGVWLRADPVDLRPDLSAVWVKPGARLSPQAAVVSQLQSLFAEYGMRFELPVAERGYVGLDACPDCHFEPPWALPGISLDELMPSGPDARQWHGLMSECQILLHQHREGDMPGGLWFWGAGQLPSRETVNSRVSRVVASDPVLVALAEWLNLPLKSNESPESGCCEDVLIEWPARYELSAEDNLQRLDAFLKPAWRRLQLGRLDAIEVAGRERIWRVTTRDSRQFWKRGRRSLQ